jgi:hypothetical protein
MKMQQQDAADTTRTLMSSNESKLLRVLAYFAGKSAAFAVAIARYARLDVTSHHERD